MATKVKLIADGVITPDQITLTTASTGTNTTAPATTAFVQQEISALVDSSPDALNTLNELAAALGDDANFSTTVTNSIATKLPLAGGTLTGTLNINNSSGFGNIELGGSSGGYIDFKTPFVDDQDARIFYGGTQLVISTSADQPILLKHNNSIKLATTATGIDVTGNATFDDNGKAIFGAGSDLQIYHNGDNSFIDEVGTGILYIRAATDLRLTNADSSKLYANFEDGGASKLYHDNGLSILTTTAGAEVRESLTIGSSSNDLGTTAGDQLTPLTLRSDTSNGDFLLFTTERLADGSNWETAAHRIQRKVDATKMGYIQFGSGGSDLVTFGEGSTEYVRIDGAGQLGVGVSPLAKFHVNKDGTGQILALFSSDLGVNNRNFSILSPATDSASEPFEFSTGNSFQFTIDGSSALRIRDDGGIAIGENNTGYAGQILSVKSGTGDLVMYGESSDASCGISLRDNSSSLNITWAAEGNDHVLKKDATVYMRVYASGDNLALGHIALESNTSGVSNTGIGTYALRENTSGGYNTAIGAISLRDNLTGSNLTAVGYGALVLNTGSNNTAVGYKSLHLTTSGENNTAIGSSALLSNTTGRQNVSVGSTSLDANTTGENNVAVGHDALSANTTASENTAVGGFTLNANTTGARNTAVGNFALINNTTASNNTGVGRSALQNNTTGYDNVAVGRNALDANVGGHSNTAVGESSLTTNTSGYRNTAVGQNALATCSTGIENTALGQNAANDVSTGSYNVAIGQNALAFCSTGSGNICVGVNAGDAITANDNVCVGRSAGTAITGTNGKWNVAVGFNALQAQGAAFSTTAVGQNCLYSNIAIGSTAYGSNTCSASTTGEHNNGFGYFTLNQVTTSSNNAAFGTVAGRYITTGTSNSCFGISSGGAITTGNYNTAIGYNSSATTTTGSNNTTLGYDSRTSGANAQGQISIGSSVTGTTNNRVHIGNSSSHIYANYNSNATWTHSSDERAKKDIMPSNLGLDFINDLKPVTYKFKAPSEYPTEWQSYGANKTKPIDEKTHHGMIAQDIKKALDKSGVNDFEGWDVLPDGKQQISESMFVFPLIKAVQELSTQVDELKQEIKNLKGE